MQTGRQTQKGQTDRHKSSGIFQFKESLKHSYNAYSVLSDIAVWYSSLTPNPLELSFAGELLSLFLTENMNSYK